MLAQRQQQADQLRWQQHEAEAELRKQREAVEALKVQSKDLKQQHYDTKTQLLAHMNEQARVKLYTQDRQQLATQEVSPAQNSAAYAQPTGLKLLWEGGYLWKIPFNSSKMPQRRWFQASQVGSLF
jgi:predicted phage tail protein